MDYNDLNHKVKLRLAPILEIKIFSSFLDWVQRNGKMSSNHEILNFLQKIIGNEPPYYYICTIKYTSEIWSTDMHCKIGPKMSVVSWKSYIVQWGIVPLNEPNDRADFWLWHHLEASHKVRNYTSLLFQNHLLST